MSIGVSIGRWFTRSFYTPRANISLCLMPVVPVIDRINLYLLSLDQWLPRLG